MNILQSMDDPEFFAPFFKRKLLRGDTWQAWRVFLAALFGLPMDSEQLAIYTQHTGRTVAPVEQFNEGFCITGRRGGKSRISALIGTYLAAFRDYDEYLAPGEQGILMILASDRAQAKNILSYVNGFFDSVPVLKAMVVNRLKESIELSNRVTIAVHTSSFKATRGYTIIGVIADELAFWQDDSGANPASEVLAAVRPGMVTIPGALLLGISSAYAKRGVLFDAYREHYGKDDSQVLVWKAASKEMNPTIVLPRLWDAVRGRSEYGGEFREDSSSLFDLEVVERLTISGRLELPPVPGRTYVAFTDPSGGAVDSFTLSVAHTDKERNKAVLDCIREVVPPFSPDAVVKEFCALLKTYRISEVFGDAYAKDWVSEPFQKNGVNYRLAGMNRSEIYLSFLAAVMSGQVELLESKKLLHQLTSLERSPRSGGHDLIDHPSGEHDDVANSVAGVLARVVGGQGGVVLTFTNWVNELYDKYGDAWREFIGKDDMPVEQVEIAPSMRPPFAPATGREAFSENASVIRAQAQRLTVTCPLCNGTAVVKRGPLYHANCCGVEWPVPGATSDPPVGQRKELFNDSRQSWPRQR